MKKIIRNSLVSPVAVLAMTILVLAGIAVGTPMFNRSAPSLEYQLDEVVIYSAEELTIDEVTIYAVGEQQ